MKETNSKVYLAKCSIIDSVLEDGLIHKSEVLGYFLVKPIKKKRIASTGVLGLSNERTVGFREIATNELIITRINGFDLESAKDIDVDASINAKVGDIYWEVDELHPVSKKDINNYLELSNQDIKDKLEAIRILARSELKDNKKRLKRVK